MGNLSGRRFAVVTLGCRANHYEAEALASMLEQEGAVFESEDAQALDVVILVTCTITSTSDNKTRKLIRRFRRRHPDAAIVACGCYAQGTSAALAAELGVDLLVGNGLKHKIPGALGAWFGEDGGFVEIREDGRRDVWDALTLDRPRMHTRAFVKIQDGCGHGCSYCIVPRVRGAPLSRDPEEVYREVERIISSGCREVILTGVHLGGYRYRGLPLGGLIRTLSSLCGLSRLRLGSLEPFGVDDDLLDALASSKIFCPHLHLPLQSGDDGILRRMCRGYTAGGFAGIAGRVREVLGGDVHLSTDLIVGFPGESERAFHNSLALIEGLGFGKVHVFPFSPRKGTAAAAFSDVVAPHLVKRRAAEAISLSDRLLTGYASRWVGREISLMVEKNEDGNLSGWSRHYVRVYASAPGKSQAGTEISLIPEASAGGILLGAGIAPENIAVNGEDF